MSEGVTSKYYPLQVYLRQNGEDEITLTLAKIEEILGVALPATARAQRAWWSNRSSGAVQAAAWMHAGYHAEDVDLQNEQITFRRPGRVYAVRQIDGEPVWDAGLVKALRHHLTMTQIELAQELGVRQPTISEWETGAYEPRGASTKILTVVAEQAGFPYITGS
jgi:DNA-binding transcriptional regulator YiaG